MTFNLHACVREFLATTDEPDPHRLAEIIFATLTPEQCVDAIRIVLPGYIADIARHQAAQNRQSTSLLPTSTAPKPTNNTARKLISEWAERTRRERINMSPHFTKFLNDCTAEDLRQAAAFNAKLSVENKISAERKEKLAAALEEASAETVADLPDSTLQVVYV